MSEKSSQNNRILTIGAPLIDVVISVTDPFISTLKGKKGGMELVTSDAFQDILSKAGTPLGYFVGGSSANVAKGLAGLGLTPFFLGTVGKDDFGAMLAEKFQELGIQTILEQASVPTGRCLCLVTPDAKRTMRTYLGASTELSPIDLNYSLVHFEGYLMDRGDLLEKMMGQAKKNGAKISLDLGSFEMIRRYQTPFQHLIKSYVDILFCNTQEAESLTQKAPLTIVTNGDQGGKVYQHDKIISYRAFPVKTVDTTGAGDFFTSGFLYGYMGKAGLETCCEIGAKVASEVVKIPGTDLSESTWENLKAFAQAQV